MTRRLPHTLGITPSHRSPRPVREQLGEKDGQLLPEHRPVLLEMPHLLRHLDKDVAAPGLASKDNLGVLVDPRASDGLALLVVDFADAETGERTGEGDALVQIDDGRGEGERQAEHVGTREVEIGKVDFDMRRGEVGRRRRGDLPVGRNSSAFESRELGCRSVSYYARSFRVLFFPTGPQAFSESGAEYMRINNPANHHKRKIEADTASLRYSQALPSCSHSR
jgi:hypothetical protein